jgi:hypothetical protein
MYGDDYEAALKTVKTWSESSDGVPVSVMADMDEFLTDVAGRAIDASAVLHTGQPWVCLTESMTQP